jgi:hypothetical protein
LLKKEKVLLREVSNTFFLVLNILSSEMKTNAVFHKKTEGGLGNAFYIFFEKKYKMRFLNHFTDLKTSIYRDVLKM